MQLMIDTAADTTTLMRRAAQFLITEADARDADESTPPAFRIPALTPAAPVREAAPVIDTAAVFAKKPAGLDGHGETKTAAPVILTDVAPVPIPVAPPAPIAIVPAAPAAPAAPAEYDSAGIPWDARIHQTAKGKKTDATWKLKKGLDPSIATAVMAELRNVTPAAVAPPPPATAPVAPPPPATDTSSIAAVPGTPAQGSVTAFRELMQKITANTNTGKLTNDEVDAALKSVNLPPRQLISLVQNPDKVGGVAAYIDAVLAAKG